MTGIPERADRQAGRMTTWGLLSLLLEAFFAGYVWWQVTPDDF